jgi:hypothetical protein
MIPDRVIYTDGHNVIVTETAIRVKNSLYRLKGVTKYTLSTIEPERVPGLILLTFGFLLTIVGVFSVIPAAMAQGLQFGKIYVGMNAVALAGGILFLILGLVVSIITKKKYGVRIATALGEQDVVVSDKKEYISQIVDALDVATVDKNMRKVKKV